MQLARLRRRRSEIHSQLPLSPHLAAAGSCSCHLSKTKLQLSIWDVARTKTAITRFVTAENVVLTSLQLAAID